jgi:hypothetical protein
MLADVFKLFDIHIELRIIVVPRLDRFPDSLKHEYLALELLLV